MTKAQDLRERTARFACGIVRLCQEVAATPAGRRIGEQLLDAGTSVGANYRAACRARSAAEFVAKIGLVAEEADESEFWLRLLKHSRLCDDGELDALLAEAGELTAIFGASHRTAKLNLQGRKRR